MLISEYLAIAKDAVIVAAIVGLGWFLYHSGANSVRVSDIEALQKQLVANAQTQDRYRNEINDALAEANSEMGNLAHSIDANKRPVVVRVPASSGAVPGNTSSTTSTDPEAGGVDIRPGVNAFERKYEAALAECRALKEAWPK